MEEIIGEVHGIGITEKEMLFLLELIAKRGERE